MALKEGDKSFCAFEMRDRVTIKINRAFATVMMVSEMSVPEQSDAKNKL